MLNIIYSFIDSDVIIIKHECFCRPVGSPEDVQLLAGELLA